MRKFISVWCFVFVSLAASAQVRMNNTIDPSDSELNTAVRFLSTYFSEFYGSHLPDFNNYWSPADCARYHYPDHLMYAINTEIPTYMLGQPTILSAKEERGNFHIRTLFAHVDSADKILVISITNHYIAKAADGHLYLTDAMLSADVPWLSSTAGDITYYYPPYHHFDKKKAQSMANDIKKLRDEWSLAPIKIQYYFSDTKEELEHYRGFDFTINMGNRDKPSGMSDGVDNIIYCNGWGEDYFHEAVHLYLNKLHPRSPLNEGLAVMYGGSLGHALGWHIKRINEYLKAHPDTDLDHPEKFYYLDNYTNPYASILGMICKIIYQKEGVAGLQRVLAYTTLEEVMSKEFGVEKGGLDKWLKDEIAKMGE